MSQERIKTLLQQLQQELANTTTVDAETLAQVKQLDSDIDQWIEDAEDVNSPIMEDAIALEARFAANHPVAERLIREVIDTLARIGI
jgi:vacuolar-type H+-ATPase subunit H